MFTRCLTLAVLMGLVLMDICGLPRRKLSSGTALGVRAWQIFIG